MTIRTENIEGYAMASEESVRIAMDQAWRDHQHARSQTWDAVKIETAYAGGLVLIDVQFHNKYATILAALSLCVLTIFIWQMTLHHRKYEIRKFTHILNCEEFLGLHQPTLICDVKPPEMISWYDAFLFWKVNTAILITRIHLAIMIFAVLLALFRSMA